MFWFWVSLLVSPTPSPPIFNKRFFCFVLFDFDIWYPIWRKASSSNDGLVGMRLRDTLYIIRPIYEYTLYSFILGFKTGRKDTGKGWSLIQVWNILLVRWGNSHCLSTSLYGGLYPGLWISDTHLMWNPPWLDQDPDPFQLLRLERSENYETSFLFFLKNQTKKFFRKKSSTHFARKKNTKIFREIIFNKVLWLGHTAFLWHKNIWEMFLSQNFLSQTGNFISIWNLRKLFWKITRSLGAHFFFMTHNIWLMYLF